MRSTTRERLRRFPRVGCEAQSSRRQEQGEHAPYRVVPGLCGKARSSNPVRPAPSTASSAMRIVRGQLYEGPSWLDGQPSMVLDYSQTSLVYANNRDEIRQVAPGLFLGLMYDRSTAPPRLAMYFALESRP